MGSKGEIVRMMLVFQEPLSGEHRPNHNGQLTSDSHEGAPL